MKISRYKILILTVPFVIFVTRTMHTEFENKSIEAENTIKKMIETNRIEFKRELTPEVDIEKEIVAFLNYKEGGHCISALIAMAMR